MTLNSYLYNDVWLCTEEAMQTMIGIANRTDSDIPAVAAKIQADIDYYAANGLDSGLSKRSSIVGSVGVVQISGPMIRYGDSFTDVSGATSSERVAADIEALLANESVSNIILSIDSPGGAVNGTSALADLIYANRGRISAHVKGMAASAAYWIASAAGEIFIEDTSSVGNIGAIMAMRKKDSDMIEFISSVSPNKAPDPESKEGQAEYQKRVDDYGNLFVGAVARHRGMGPDEIVSRFGEGSVFLGSDAVSVGLADGIMSLADMITSKQNNVKGISMTNVENKTAEPQASAEDEIAVARARAAKAEAALADRDRLDGIKAVLSAHEGVLAKDAEALILEDSTQTVASVSEKLLDALATKSVAAPLAEPKVETKQYDSEAMAHAIILKSGMATREGVQIDAGSLHAQAPDLATMSLKQMVGAVTGLDLNVASDGEVMAAMTTGQFPIILSNVQNKIVAEVFEKAPTTYRQWTKSVPLRDFKAVTEVRKGSFGNDFKKLTEGGALRYGTKTEEGLTWRLYRYAKKFALTYEMIINDDLGMFTDDLADLIENVERFKNRQVYDMLLARGEYAGYVMADGKPVFHADHGNLTTPGTAVSINSLGVGFNAIAAQKDFDGSQLAITPKHLIIPFVDQWDVSQVVNSTASNEDSKNAATFNPANKRFNVIPEFELNDQDAWFLAGDKRTIKTGYLASEGESPIVEEVRNSRIHGIEYELAFSFGIVVNDYRAMYRNDGAV